MAGHDPSKFPGWSGRWRPRRSRRIEVSPDFAEFLAGELDSRDYARSLTRSRRSSGLAGKSRQLGPIAQAAEEVAVKNAKMAPTVVSGDARVSPEYLRFLHDEISSWEYAEAVADCAKLEGMYRTPAARVRFPRPSFLEASIDAVRLALTTASFALFVLGLLLVVAPLGARLVSTVMQSGWAMTVVGAVMVLVTLFGPALSLVGRAVQLVHRSLGQRSAQQRA